MNIGYGVAAAALVLAGCERARLDQQVRELCAKDGGITVYEVVRLPAEKFNKWGDIVFYDPTKKEAALGDEYRFEKKVDYYKKGDPDAGMGQSVMARREYRIIRRTDGKLLGFTVIYGRRGGDIPGPWYPSSTSCPSPNEAGDVALLRKIFVSTN